MRLFSLWSRPWISSGIAVVVTVLICAAAQRPETPVPASSLADLKELYRRPEGIPFPRDNPYTEAKSKLGRMLFFDPILSGARDISCSSCHNPALSWSDGLSLANGSGRMKLHTPTMIDVAWIPTLGWDGKFKSLESVAFGPLLNPANMNNTEAEIVSRLSRIPGYVEAFAQAFPESKPGDAKTGDAKTGDAKTGDAQTGDAQTGDAQPGDIVTRRRIELAMATFERTIVATRAPFDRWIEGDENAVDNAAKRGFVLFNGKAGCSNCHVGPSFSDFSFHDIGVAHEDDLGRGQLFPTSMKLRHAFKVPTLRDVARRAPYMHDGSIATLEAVVDAYDTGGIDRPSRSELIRPLGLSAAEKRDLISFMNTLTGEQLPVELPALPR